MGWRVLKTPMRTPQANAFCETLIGTMRREVPGLAGPDRRNRRVTAHRVFEIARGLKYG